MYLGTLGWAVRYEGLNPLCFHMLSISRNKIKTFELITSQARSSMVNNIFFKWDGFLWI